MIGRAKILTAINLDSMLDAICFKFDRKTKKLAARITYVLLLISFGTNLIGRTKNWLQNTSVVCIIPFGTNLIGRAKKLAAKKNFVVCLIPFGTNLIGRTKKLAAKYLFSILHKIWDKFDRES